MTTTTLTNLPLRQSPLHEQLEHLHARWATIADMPVAASFGDLAREAQQAQVLGVCDVSALSRVTLKGAGAKPLLEDLSLPVPARFGEVTVVGGTLIARTGGTEFFVEDTTASPAAGAIARMNGALTGDRPSLICVKRQDCSLLLSGARGHEVMAQTCGYDFRARESRLVFTRVAGVSCSILPRTLNSIPVYQLWLDGSYGVYLWEQLLEIAFELVGDPSNRHTCAVGAAAFFPELSGTEHR